MLMVEYDGFWGAGTNGTSSCSPVLLSEASSTRQTDEMDSEKGLNVLLQANEETETCVVSEMGLRGEFMNLIHSQ